MSIEDAYADSVGVFRAVMDGAGLSVGRYQVLEVVLRNAILRVPNYGYQGGAFRIDDADWLRGGKHLLAKCQEVIAANGKANFGFQKFEIDEIKHHRDAFAKLEALLKSLRRLQLKYGEHIDDVPYGKFVESTVNQFQVFLSAQEQQHPTYFQHTGKKPALNIYTHKFWARYLGFSLNVFGPFLNSVDILPEFLEAKIKMEFPRFKQESTTSPVGLDARTIRKRFSGHKYSECADWLNQWRLLPDEFVNLIKQL